MHVQMSTIHSWVFSLPSFARLDDVLYIVLLKWLQMCTEKKNKYEIKVPFQTERVQTIVFLAQIACFAKGVQRVHESEGN